MKVFSKKTIKLSPTANNFEGVNKTRKGVESHFPREDSCVSIPNSFILLRHEVTQNVAANAQNANVNNHFSVNSGPNAFFTRAELNTFSDKHLKTLTTCIHFLYCINIYHPLLEIVKNLPVLMVIKNIGDKKKENREQLFSKNFFFLAEHV